VNERQGGFGGVAKEDFLLAIIEHLRRKGVDAQLLSEKRQLPLGLSTTETGIRLIGQEIDSIWADELGSSYGKSGFRCQFRVLLDKPVSKELRHAVHAQNKFTRQGKFLGLFGGQIVGVKWVSGSLADSLAGDTAISRMLAELGDVCGAHHVNVTHSDAQGESVVMIEGPRLPYFTVPQDLGVDEKHERFDKVLNLDWAVPLDVYNTIAQHVRHVAQHTASLG
jgi:hypothetical protein